MLRVVIFPKDPEDRVMKKHSNLHMILKNRLMVTRINRITSSTFHPVLAHLTAQ
jgi:hypothetical protein